MTDTHTKEHSHAQVLRWIADGKTVHYDGRERTTEKLFEFIVEDLSVEDFTLAPRRIKVGSREINAPMDVAPNADTEYWFVSSDGEVENDYWAHSCGVDLGRLEQGNVWATETDATAARDAWRELMKGQV